MQACNACTKGCIQACSVQIIVYMRVMCLRSICVWDTAHTYKCMHNGACIRMLNATELYIELAVLEQAMDMFLRWLAGTGEEEGKESFGWFLNHVCFQCQSLYRSSNSHWKEQAYNNYLCSHGKSVTGYSLAARWISALLKNRLSWDHPSFHASSINGLRHICTWRATLWLLSTVF